MSYYDLQTSARYVQCPNTLQEIKRYTFGMGRKFLVVTACGPVKDYVISTIQKSFSNTMESMLIPGIAEKNFRYNRQIEQARRFDRKNREISAEFVDFDGKEITYSKVNELVDIIQNKQPCL